MSKGMRYTHRIDGEEVVVTGHVNGITIYDSEDEQGQELLDEVFAESYEPVSHGIDQQRIVVVGNPSDGFSYHGPFATFEDAETFAGHAGVMGDWWVCDLHAPSAPEYLAPEYTPSAEDGA